MGRECDSCNHEMNEPALTKALDCGCDICGPWMICKECHVQIENARRINGTLINN